MSGLNLKSNSIKRHVTYKWLLYMDNDWIYKAAITTLHSLLSELEYWHASLSTTMLSDSRKKKQHSCCMLHDLPVSDKDPTVEAASLNASKWVSWAENKHLSSHSYLEVETTSKLKWNQNPPTASKCRRFIKGNLKMCQDIKKQACGPHCSVYI